MDYINKHTAAFLLGTDLKGLEKYVKYGAITKTVLLNRSRYNPVEIQEFIAARERKLTKKDIRISEGESNNG